MSTKGTTVVIRIKDFCEYDFIEEHKKVIDKYGYVWILKIGKSIGIKAFDTISENNKLLLKESKHKGGKCFLCNAVDTRDGKAEDIDRFPLYYYDIEQSGVSLIGSWIKVNSISELSEEEKNRLVLEKSGKNMEEVFASTMSPLLYVKDVN